MLKSISIFATLALALALIATGCGSDSSGSDSSISKAEFFKQASDICEEVDEEQYNQALAYAKKHQKEISKLGIKAYREKVNLTLSLPLIQKEVKELEALGAPDGDEKQIEALIAAVEKGIAESKKNPALMDELGIKSPFLDATNIAREYGLKECRTIG